MHDCKDLKIPDNNTPGSAFKVYGSGCERTAKIGENIIEAQKILGIDEGVEYTIDIFKIFDAGVMNNPGLIIDGQLVCEGRVLNVDELVEIIKFVRKIG